MSENKIEEIRERHAQSDKNYIELESTWDIHADRATLLAEVERLRAENKRLRDALSWYADPRNHFPVEHRRPGDPDPAVIFVEEPPIMLDGGERARRALECKP